MFMVPIETYRLVIDPSRYVNSSIIFASAGTNIPPALGAVLLKSALHGATGSQPFGRE
jgi:hypothetical protein